MQGSEKPLSVIRNYIFGPLDAVVSIKITNVNHNKPNLTSQGLKQITFQPSFNRNVHRNVPDIDISKLIEIESQEYIQITVTCLCQCFVLAFTYPCKVTL